MVFKCLKAEFQTVLLRPKLRMQNLTDFFAEFPTITKAQWLERIEKDLKGKPLADLYWAVDGMDIDPFGHADDFRTPPQPLWDTPKSWEICENIEQADPVEANHQAMEALSFGAEGLRFHINSMETEALESLLTGIHLDYIGLHFSSQNWNVTPPAALLAEIGNLSSEKGIDPETLRGTLAYAPAQQTGLVDWRYASELMAYAKTGFPGLKMLRISDETAPHHVIDGLAHMLQQAHVCLDKCAAEGHSPEKTADQLYFDVSIGQSYFLEMAKLRALHLLWLNLLKAWNIAPIAPTLHVRFRADVYTDDLYTNMIRATTMSMAAVMGGADQLTVLPYDAGRQEISTYPQAFARRIARNVQHLLKMESYLDTFADPAAGSYYIEQMTMQIADKAWVAFRQQN